MLGVFVGVFVGERGRLCWCARESVLLCEGVACWVSLLGVFVGICVVTSPGLSALSPLLSAPSPQLC